MTINPSIFRKYDIRGICPKDINPQVVAIIVARLGKWFTARPGKTKIIILGHDARVSSEILYHAAWKTLLTYPNLTVLPVGLITTPMLYYLVSARHAAGGLLITASHSPIAYNGMKVVREASINISGLTIGEWVHPVRNLHKISKSPQRFNNPNPSTKQRNISNGIKEYTPPSNHLLPQTQTPVPKPARDYYQDYADFLTSLSKNITRPLKVVVDCSNSPAALILKKISQANIRLTLLNTKPDGHFPGHGPNPLNPGAMDQAKRAVRRLKADFGVVLDGDADRAIFIDDLGRAMHPDITAFLLMRAFRPPFVMDARTGWLVRHSQYPIFLSQVGHTSVKKVIRSHNANFGAETSGHFFFKNVFGKTVAYNDSSLQAVMHTLPQVAALKKKGQKLSDWIDSLPESARAEVNFEVKRWPPIQKRLKQSYTKRKFNVSHLDGVTVENKGKTPSFWFNLRPSNTEPILRLSIEAQNQSILGTELGKLIKLIRPLHADRQGIS